MKTINLLAITCSLLLSQHAFAADNQIQQAAWIPQLDNYLKYGQYASARKITSTQPAAAVLERLKPWADSGLTPAQWMYAETLLLAGRDQESADWTYIAFFNTRLDASLCNNNDARGLERTIVSSFNRTVQQARISPEIMTQAIINAINYQKSKNKDYISKKKPEWICLMVANADKSKSTIPNSQWAAVYQENLDNFINKTKGKKED